MNASLEMLNVRKMHTATMMMGTINLFRGKSYDTEDLHGAIQYDFR